MITYIFLSCVKHNLNFIVEKFKSVKINILCAKILFYKKTLITHTYVEFFLNLQKFASDLHVMFTYAMIKGNWIDDHKSIKIIFVRYIIAMPRDYVEGTVALIGHKQLSLIFAYDFIINFTILVPSHRCLKVSRTRQAIRSCILAPLIN